MTNIVDINKTKPTMTGPAKCLSCRHEWQAVSSVGTKWMQCPACDLLMGRAMGPVSEEGLHWQCKCGNDLFYIKKDHAYCAVCGTTNVY